MNETAATSWKEANKAFLLQALDNVRQALSSYAENDEPAQPTLPTWPQTDTDSRPALISLTETLGLSPFERHLVLLCAGMELDPAMGAACAAANRSTGMPYPTFGLALAALADNHWSALTPSASLRHWRIIEVDSGDSLVSSRLRIDERILHFLVGVDYVDERLRDLITIPGEEAELVPSQLETARRLAAHWPPSDDRRGWKAIQLTGQDRSAKLAVAQAVAGLCGLRLRILTAHAIPSDPRQFEAAVRLWQRESALGSYALLIEADSIETDDRDTVRRVMRWLSQSTSPSLLSCREPLPRPHQPMQAVEIGVPTREEQNNLWSRELESCGLFLDGHLSELMAQFDLTAPAIRSACAAGRAAAETDNESESGAAPQPAHLLNVLWNACRDHSRTSMDDLAQRIVSRVTWEDLILPDEQMQLLHELVGNVRQRYRVYHEWGFELKGERGLGITALFHGVSGTGKTLAADVIARQLNLDLYRIDLSSVVSRYIGETEANLRRVFDAAEEGGAVLLFDEADALYGKRSEVRDSHDRHANIEVSYLLQRMEAYRGLAILTTNMKDALDEAFLRRIRFIVSFPFPDRDYREAIWRSVFPTATPKDDLDFEKAAQLSVTGGSIRNMALHAAFMAADAKEPVGMNHLLRAARVEFAKLERPFHIADAETWV